LLIPTITAVTQAQGSALAYKSYVNRACDLKKNIYWNRPN